MIACVTTLARNRETLLSHFPLSGSELSRTDTHTLRRLRLRRAPFYVYHLFDEATGRVGPVRFLRLFHTGQSTPGPQLP